MVVKAELEVLKAKVDPLIVPCQGAEVRAQKPVASSGLIRPVSEEEVRGGMPLSPWPEIVQCLSEPEGYQPSCQRDEAHGLVHLHRSQEER